jgi:putative ABC transport system permease protein
MATLWQDVRYGFRRLARNPGFSLFVVLLMAVGVGGSTTVFSIVNAFLLRPLPYHEPNRITFLRQRTLQGRNVGVSYLNYLDWRQQARSFDDLGCYFFNSFPVNVPGADLPEMCSLGVVSSSFFHVLGVAPCRGRLFAEEDDRSSPNPVAAISYAFWQRHFGADPNVIGRTVVSGNNAVTVIGVMPPGFRYPAYGRASTDVWVPVGLVAGSLQDRASSPDLYVLGRLKRGVSLAQAQAEMDAISAHLAAQYPSADGNSRAQVVALHAEMVKGRERAFLLMLGAVVLVFLVACVNAAGLLVARGVVREREMAVCSALGAGRLRLMWQMTVENTLLAGVGGLLGVWAAAGAVRLLAHTGMVASLQLPPDFLRLELRVLGFAVAATVLAIPLFGLLPSLLCSRIALTRVLGSEGRGILGARGRSAVYGGLVGTEAALTMVLLVVAGLLARSFVNVATADLGFDRQRVLTMSVILSNDAQRQELLERVRAMPDVEKAALTFPLFTGWQWYVCVEGEPVVPTAEENAIYKVVSPGYFETMGIRLLQGRTFDEQDRADARLVAIVDETLAKRHWPRGDAVGKRIHYGRRPDPNSPGLEIVGVVAHVRNEGVEGGTAVEVYRPLLQRPTSSFALVLRAKGDPAFLIAPVKDVVRRIERRYPITEVQTLDQIQGSHTVTRRLITSLAAVFAGVALFLSTVGIYAVTRYSVARRTQEFGVRLALGADGKDVFRLVLGKGLLPVVTGAGVGLAGTVVVARLLSSLLFRLSPWDPLTYAAGPLVLIAAALLASYLPARRAARIDPMVALRCE